MFQKPSPVVLNLIIINVIVCIALNLLPFLQPYFELYKSNLLHIHPTILYQGEEYYAIRHLGEVVPIDIRPDQFLPLQIVTHFFAHIDLFHILFNMVALLSIGTAVEMVMGSRNFAIFYLFCGVIGGLFVAFLDPTINPVLGASGAICGVIAAFGFLYPNAGLYMFFIPIAIPAKYVALGIFAFSLLMVLFNSNFGNISHFGHLAGMVAAGIYFLLRKYLVR